MKNLLRVFACLALAFVAVACEQPKSPNFKLNHEIQAPLTSETSYAFLGRDKAFIDTTTTDIIDLLASDGSGLVLLNQFNLSLFNISLVDTLNGDLSTLPNGDDEQVVSEAIITLDYVNHLPLNLQVIVNFIDKDGNSVIRKDDIEINSASTNSEGIVDQGGEEDKTDISFSRAEIARLYRTRSIIIGIDIDTNLQQAVKFNADDGIELQIKLKTGITTTVN